MADDSELYLNKATETHSPPIQSENELYENCLAIAKQKLKYLLRNNPVYFNDIDDLAQDTALKIYNLNSETKANIKNWNAYVATVATNLFFDCCRQSRRLKLKSLENEISMIEDGKSGLLQRKLEICQIIDKFFYDLTEEQRSVATMLLMGLDLKEMAAFLHKSEGAVYTASCRIRGKMKANKDLSDYI